MVKAVPEQPQQKKKAQKRSSMPRGYIVRHLDEAIEKKWIKVYYQPLCGRYRVNSARWSAGSLG